MNVSDKIVFTLKDIKDITNLQGGTATKLAYDLVKRNVIARLKYGKYVIIPQEIGYDDKYVGNWYVVAREIVKSPHYYISHYSAMELHNMATHPLTKVFVVSPKQEYKKRRTVGNITFEFIYTSAKSIWGVKDVWITKSEQVRTSDIERTIIDCLYSPKYCGGVLEIAKGMWIQKDRIDYAKLLDYARRFNRNNVIKRLGYIAENLQLLDSGSLEKLRSKINNKYYKLDPLLPSQPTFRNSWKCIANISPEELKKAVAV